MLIVDRSVDVTSMLLHELTYQVSVMLLFLNDCCKAAAYDLLPIENDSYNLEYTDGLLVVVWATVWCYSV